MGILNRIIRSLNELPNTKLNECGSTYALIKEIEDFQDNLANDETQSNKVDNIVPSLNEPYSSRLKQPLTKKEFEVIKKSLNLTIGNEPALKVLLYKLTRLENGVETAKEEPNETTTYPNRDDSFISENDY